MVLGLLLVIQVVQPQSLLSDSKDFLVIDKNNIDTVACRLRSQSENEVSFGMLDVVNLCDGVEHCVGGVDEDARACSYKEQASLRKKIYLYSGGIDKDGKLRPDFDKEKK